MLGPMWDTRTLIPQVLYDRLPELLFWRYVDTDVKDDPSGGWYILMKILPPNVASQLHSHQPTNIDINYTGVLFDHGLS